MNAKMHSFTSQLNHFYKEHKELREIDDSFDGLEIIDEITGDQSVLSMIRKNRMGDLWCASLIWHPVERKDFTIGVPISAVYEEIWDTELEEWEGVSGKSTIRQFGLKMDCEGL